MFNNELVSSNLAEYAKYKVLVIFNNNDNLAYFHSLN